MKKTTKSNEKEGNTLDITSGKRKIKVANPTDRTKKYGNMVRKIELLA